MRSVALGLSVFAVSLFPLVVSADTSRPNISGSWQLNAAKSQLVTPDDGITLDIESTSDKLKVIRIVHGKDGRDLKSQFDCKTDGTDCVFDAGSYKAKVSVWYDGNALQILKTDGPKDDAVTQWKVVCTDGSSLSIELTHIDPSGKAEMLVFEKKH
jgi:hypothetical protein